MCYSSSAMNVPKQTLSNFLLWHYVRRGAHKCHRQLKLCPEETSCYQDNLVYVFRNRKYKYASHETNVKVTGL